MKPEARFIKSVHDVLDSDVYREKMFNPMRGGTPDCVYYGYRPGPDLWVEYKWLASKAPRVWKPDLSPLQMAWLMRSWDRGREPWVVVGSPTGCVVLREPAEWLHGIARDKAQVLSKLELARRIADRCGLSGLPGSQPGPGISTG